MKEVVSLQWKKWGTREEQERVEEGGNDLTMKRMHGVVEPLAFAINETSKHGDNARETRESRECSSVRI